MQSWIDRRVLWASSTASLVVLLATASLAGAAEFKPQITEVAASNYFAGSSTTLTVEIDKGKAFSEQRLKSFSIQLPRGFFADISKANYCQLAKIGSGQGCSNPAASRLGKVQLAVSVDLNPGAELDVGEVIVNSVAYLDSPQGSELARIVAIPTNQNLDEAFVSTVSLTEQSDRLVVSSEDLPTKADLLGTQNDIDVHGIKVTLGDSGESSDISVFNPTLCDGQNSVDATFTSYADNGDLGSTLSDSAPYPVSSCDAVPYEPRLELALPELQPGTLFTLAPAMVVPAGHATTREARISLPPGLTPESGAVLCGSADFAAGACDGGSRIATVALSSPLLMSQLTGTLHLGPAVGSALQVGLFTSGAVSMRVYGTLEERPDRGIDLVLRDLPPLPISSLDLAQGSADGLSVRSPFSCGHHLGGSSFTSYTGKTAGNSHALDVVGCQRGLGNRSDNFKAKVYPPKAGSDVDLTLALQSRPGRSYRRLSVTLPRALKVRFGRLGRKSRSFISAEAWDSEDRALVGTPRLVKQTHSSYLFRVRSGSLKGLKLKLTRAARSRLTVSGLPKTELQDLKIRVFARQHRLFHVSKKSPRTLRFTAAFGSRSEGGLLTGLVSLRGSSDARR